MQRVHTTVRVIGPIRQSVRSVALRFLSSAALRALAVTTGRDIVLLNGVPRSVNCRVVIFYAHPTWTPGPTLFDLLPLGQAALAAWLRDGSGGSAGAPARAIGAPLFVVWNGTNHFDSVETVPTARGGASMQEAGRPKVAGPCPTSLKVLSPSVAVAPLPPGARPAARRLRCPRCCLRPPRRG